MLYRDGQRGDGNGNFACELECYFEDWSRSLLCLDGQKGDGNFAMKVGVSFEGYCTQTDKSVGIRG